MDPITRPLRFGVLGRGTTFARWEARCLGALLALPDVRPALLLQCDWGAGLDPAAGSPLLFRAAARLPRPTAWHHVDLASRLEGIPSVQCRGPAVGERSFELDPTAVQRVQEERLDFVLQFGPQEVRGDGLRAPRHGVWRFRFGERNEGGGGPPGFWEVCRGEFATGAALVRLADREDADVVLRKGFFRTSLESFARTVDAVLLGVVDWPASVCRDLRAGDAGYLDAPPSPVGLPEMPPPTNAETVRLLGLEAARTVGALYRGLVRHDDWTIGVVDAPIRAFLERDFRPAVGWIPPPGDARFIADPFGLEIDGDLSIVYEDFDYRTARGTIAAIPAGEAVPRTAPRVAIELTVPSSYPFLFHHDANVYCIPETHAAREVSLYRLVEFPDRWDKVATLLRGIAAVDSTVFPHDGRWWLMCTDHDQGENLRLFIWHAPRLEGPWEPHAANPVKTDIRSSRPGGTPFVHAGALYRPAQDCSRTYGGRIVINRVARLTPTAFEEETVAAVGPLSGTRFPEGVHTLSAVGERTVLDGKRYRFMPRAVPYVVRRGLAGARP